MRASTLDRLERLEFLKSRMKSGDALTVQDIARELGISTRTVSRDIEILREQGVPIEADRGRGGGIRLQTHWGIGRINFSYSEAIDLMITLAIAEQMKSPLFMANLKSIRAKLYSSFTPILKSKVKNLKDRILITPSASIGVLTTFSTASKETTERLHQAFLMQQRMRMTYQDADGNTTKRVIEPHILLLSYPVWYVVAWDMLREDVRTFRCDRIQRIQIQNSEFNLFPRARFKEILEGMQAL